MVRELPARTNDRERRHFHLNGNVFDSRKGIEMKIRFIELEVLNGWMKKHCKCQRQFYGLEACFLKFVLLCILEFFLILS